MIKTMLIRAIIVVLSASVPVFGSNTALAQSNDPVKNNSSDTQSRNASRSEGLTISPYLWGPDISGTVSLGPINAPVDLNLSQLASGLKIGGMGHVQYNKGSGFLYAEAIGAKFGDPEFSSFANQPVRASAILLETGAGLNQKIPLDENLSIRISPYAGIRYVKLQAAVSGPVIAVSGENEWVDPVAGAIADVQLDKRWSLVGKADFAGLSISKNSYRNLALGLQFQVNRKLSLFGGYRSTKGNFRADEGLSADLSANGPMIGIRYQLAN
jgi:hypothetical protein